MKVTKTFGFDSAHRLMNHSGKCAALHGHRYKLEVTVEGPTNPDTGIVVDFSDLSKVVKGFVDNFWDHALLVNFVDPLKKAVEAVEEVCLKTNADAFRIFSFMSDPTAEHMVRYFAEIVWPSIITTELSGVTLSRVRLYETPTSYAEWEKWEKPNV